MKNIMPNRKFFMPERRCQCKNIFKLIIHISSFLTYVLLGVYFLVWSPSIFGIKPLTVQSDSMHPCFSEGSIIYYHASEYISNLQDQLQEGTIISFEHVNQNKEKVLVSHRIYRLSADASFETKGDNNTESDKNKVNLSDVRGIVYNFSIPLLGYLIDFINSHLASIVVSVLIIILLEFILRNVDLSGRINQENSYDPKKSTSKSN